MLKLIFLVHWIHGLRREWRCSWSSTDRQCSNYIWVINNFIAYPGVPHIRGLGYIGSITFALQVPFHIYTWNPKLIINVPADVLLLKGAKPSAGPMLIQLELFFGYHVSCFLITFHSPDASMQNDSQYFKKSHSTSSIKMHFFNENDRIPIRISLKFVSRSPNDNEPALV